MELRFTFSYGTAYGYGERLRFYLSHLEELDFRPSLTILSEQRCTYVKECSCGPFAPAPSVMGFTVGNTVLPGCPTNCVYCRWPSSADRFEHSRCPVLFLFRRPMSYVGAHFHVLNASSSCTVFHTSRTSPLVGSPHMCLFCYG